ncbi:ABC transporter substrate-binding protein [Anoxynatronum buryatiense]|nr:ABC transporter substrate-binding protein [Anoxynatronum buryatiense]
MHTNNKSLSKVTRWMAWLLILLILTGCASTQPAPADSTQPETPMAQEDPLEEVAEPQIDAGKWITDAVGREVLVPDKIQRVACLYAFSGYAVTLLGDGDKIVATPGGLKRDRLLAMVNPAIEEVSVPRAGGTINVEELLNLKPDLVFVSIETAADDREMDKMDKTGIPFLVVDFTSIEDQMANIAFIGEAMGRIQEAQAFNAYYQSVIDRVEGVLAQVPMGDRVTVYHSINEATRTDIKGSLSAQWTNIAGANNVAMNQDLRFVDNKYFAALEQILLWDPEVMIVNEPDVVKYILTNPQWATLQAVKQQKVYQLPQGISRWGHPGAVETPLAILWTAKTLYPELFEDMDLKEEIQHFYRTFLAFDLEDDLTEQILQGGLRDPK